MSAFGASATETFFLKPALSAADQHTATTDFVASGTKVTISGTVMSNNGSGRVCVWDAFYYDNCGQTQMWSPNNLGGVHFGVVGSHADGPFVPAGNLPAFRSDHTYTFTSTLSEHHLWFWAVPFGHPMPALTYTGGFSVALTPMSPPTTTGAGDVAGVGSLTGEVTVKHTDGSVEPVTSATILHPGDQLETGVDSRVMLTFPDGSRMTLGEMSVVVVADLLVQGSRQNVTVAIKLGEVSAQVNPKKEYQTDFKVSTPSGTTSSRGTRFSVFFDPGAQITIARTQVHKVRFAPTRHGLGAILVPAGKEIAASRSHVSKLEPIGKAAARGGADIQTAHDLALAFLDRFAGVCRLSAPHPSVMVKPVGQKGWSVAIPIQGKATGTAVFRVVSLHVAPLTAVARTIAAGCH